MVCLMSIDGGFGIVVLFCCLCWFSHCISYFDDLVSL